MIKLVVSLIAKIKKVLKELKESINYKLQGHRIILIFILSVIIGIISGYGSILFRLMIYLNQLLFNLIPFYFGSVYIILMPAIGGLIVGILTNKFGKETKGHGVPEIMEAMLYRDGVIKKRVALLKLIVSSVTIGSGGSAGREGPIAQIGASSGSTIGQIMNLDKKDLKLLIACGVSAGIAATFNAPFGGLLFGIEVILRRLELDIKVLLNLTISIIIATLISIGYLGNHPAFVVQSNYILNIPFDFFIYLIFGVIIGLFGVGFVKFFYGIEKIFNKIKIPNYIKPLIGGIGVGLIALFFSPQIMGVGYETIEQTLKGMIPLFVLLMLCLFKIIVTSITLGSGGSGGVFAPSLFIGSTFGGTLGILFYYLFPTQISDPMVFALVGMGAFFAGIARAPLTCILMTIEMTSDYFLIIPLMLSCTISYLINQIIMKKKSIYTIKILNKGYKLDF